MRNAVRSSGIFGRVGASSIVGWADGDGSCAEVELYFEADLLEFEALPKDSNTETPPRTFEPCVFCRCGV
jgi:hypothetical protein